MNLLTKFHEDRIINVASRVLTIFYNSLIKPYKEKCPAPWRPCSSSKLLTRKTTSPPGCHDFQPTGIIFELIQDNIGINPCFSSKHIIETNFLTKFHGGWTINEYVDVARRTTDNARRTKGDHKSLPGAHGRTDCSTTICHPTGGIKINTMTKIHKIRHKIVTSRVFTRIVFNIMKCLLTKCGRTDRRRAKTDLKTSPEQSDINKTNVLTTFYDDEAKNATSIEIPPPCGHFHDDWAKNVTSRIITCTSDSIMSGHNIVNSQQFTHNNGHNSEISQQKTASHPGGHVFSPIWIIFKLVRDINKTNEKLPRPACSHVFQWTGTIFELNQHIMKNKHFDKCFTSFELDRGIIGQNLLTNFHEDRTRNEASRVFTRKAAPPILDKNVASRHDPVFKLGRDFIGTNFLTKLHEDRTRNVAFRVFTNQIKTTDGHTTEKDRSQKLT
ncbi:hypothetical protein DPMN_152348 [Dreissena polymorpha]|uniref:Uncharacterized protein n=1 Tax=Dreissena polymorpha TaxID=45954 RepID=A0A9D4FHA8_DREPO|nr:hypothetical protein DPMN_152348 [Dreissena polymorpha]